jgi:hypothetical protein
MARGDPTNFCHNAGLEMKAIRRDSETLLRCHISQLGLCGYDTPRS